MTTIKTFLRFWSCSTQPRLSRSRMQNERVHLDSTCVKHMVTRSIVVITRLSVLTASKIVASRLDVHFAQVLKQHRTRVSNSQKPIEPLKNRTKQNVKHEIPPLVVTSSTHPLQAHNLLTKQPVKVNSHLISPIPFSVCWMNLKLY